jgi:lysophospholipase L1-like esterase
MIKNTGSRESVNHRATSNRMTRYWRLHRNSSQARRASWLSWSVVLLTGTAANALFANQPLHIVGTGGRMATDVDVFATSSPSTAFWQRTPYKLGGPVAEIDVGFMNWFNNSVDEIPNANSVTINFAWLERASTGQVLPITFSGQRQLIMPAQDAAAFHLADPIPAGVWTGAALARDEIFWLHAKGAVPASGNFLMGTFATYAGSMCIVYNPANDPGAKDFAGPVPAISGESILVGGVPSLFLGRYTGPGYVSVVGIGDSILNGAGDNLNPVPVIAGLGFLSRAALDENGANAIAVMSLGCNGEKGSSWLSHHTHQAQIATFANVAVEEFGTNDIGSNGGSADASLIFTNLQGIWNVIDAAGVQKILRTRLLPRTQSTSGDWLSLADQTPNAGWGAGGARDQLNADLASALTNGQIDVHVDALSPVSDPSDNHYWLTNGTGKYTTSDGTHPSPTGHAFIAQALRAALITVVVDDYYSWAKKIAWNGADSSPTADPNGDGVSNLLAYALDISPLAAPDPELLPYPGYDTVTPNGPWLSLTFRRNERAADLTYTVRSSTDLVGWTDLVPDGLTVVEEVVDSDPDGDGSSILKRVRIKLASNQNKLFLRLQVNR